MRIRFAGNDTKNCVWSRTFGFDWIIQTNDIEVCLILFGKELISLQYVKVKASNFFFICIRLFFFEVTIYNNTTYYDILKIDKY